MEIPDETAGPYPGDGSNGPDVLTQDGVVRADITSSFGDSSGTAEGIAATIELTILDMADSDKTVRGVAVYVWHCDRDGKYSHSEGITDQNYLRGVQVADDNGKCPSRASSRRATAALATHPLRGLSRPGVDHRCVEGDRHLTDRHPEGRLRRGLCHHGL